MALPIQPSPCPQLIEGLALGAQQHKGFVAAWNWMLSIFRKAKDIFVMGVNGRTGEISIVAGEGINVDITGKTITISTGTGETTDDGTGTSTGGGASETANTPSGGTGGGGPQSTSGAAAASSSPNGSGDTSTNCNTWSQDPGNDFGGGGADNVGDDCNILNGW